VSKGGKKSRNQVIRQVIRGSLDEEHCLCCGDTRQQQPTRRQAGGKRASTSRPSDRERTHIGAEAAAPRTSLTRPPPPYAPKTWSLTSTSALPAMSTTTASALPYCAAACRGVRPPCGGGLGAGRERWGMRRVGAQKHSRKDTQINASQSAPCAPPRKAYIYL
jgi:hypothetical protein